MARAPRHQRTARSSGVAVATTLAVVVVAVGVVAYFHFHHAAATSSTTTLVTTTTLAPAAPLTGLPDPARQAFSRPALTVKVENTPEALPQWGIDRADVVYEEIVDGGITRLAAIFNSQAPAKVGPVRSVRPTDVSIVDPIKGIFAYSGGAPYAINDISAVPGLKLEDETTAGAAMYRDPTRQAPHNLYASAGALFNLGGSPAPPTALFTYSSAPWRAGVAVNKFTVDFPSIYAVTWTWNASTTSWDRTLFGQPIVTGTGVRVSPKNVVVMYVDYLGGVGAFGSKAQLVGSGEAEVFEQGRVIHATWSRPSATDVTTYDTKGGKPISMTPGQTWVELLDIGAAVPLK